MIQVNSGLSSMPEAVYLIKHFMEWEIRYCSDYVHCLYCPPLRQIYSNETKINCIDIG